MDIYDKWEKAHSYIDIYSTSAISVKGVLMLLFLKQMSVCTCLCYTTVYASWVQKPPFNVQASFRSIKEQIGSTACF